MKNVFIFTLIVIVPMIGCVIQYCTENKGKLHKVKDRQTQ